MGLDQWLSKKYFIGSQYEHKKTKATCIEIEKNGKQFSFQVENLSEIEYHVYYWRKSNQIHKWFVDNCQNGEDNCREANVSIEQLKELLGVLKQVCDIHTEIKSKKEPYKDMEIKYKEQLEKLLPTSGGFFFGETDYAEYYFADVEETREMLEKELAEPEIEGWIPDYYYSSSW